jgi:hypothetical protein
MKTRFKLLLLLLAMPVAVHAQFTFTTNNGTITITKFTGYGGQVDIPSTINGLPVAGIGDGAFYYVANLTGVTIPDSVTNIGFGAFEYCTSLTAITVDFLNPAYRSLDGVLFDKRRTTLIEYPCGKAGAYTIPISVTNIGNSAFYGCANLTSVTISSTVKIIGPGAFIYCNGLSTLTIPDSVISIGNSAFEACNLANVTIGNSVTSIGDWAFSKCTSLTSVTIPNSVAYIGWYAFSWCQGLTNITIPSSVTMIGPRAFWFSWRLTEITVDALNPVYSSVGGILFNKSQTTLIQYPAGKVGSYTVPNGVTGIGDSAFADSQALTSIIIPSSITNIEYDAFDTCINLTGVFCRGNAPSVGQFVFEGSAVQAVYYLPGTTGWGTTLGGRPTAPWYLPSPVILNFGPSFGVQTNGFGFIISWATNIPVVVEACTNLVNPTWSPLGTNSLTGGWSYFSDPQWAKYADRFYRLHSP